MTDEQWLDSLLGGPKLIIKARKPAAGQMGLFDRPVRPKAARGGPFIGPRGGKWADAKHTIPWSEPKAAVSRPKPLKAKPEPAKPKGPEQRIAERWMAMTGREKVANLQELGQQKGMGLTFDGRHYIVSQGKDHKVSVASLAEAKDLIQTGSVKGAKPAPGSLSWTKAPSGETIAVTPKEAYAVSKDNTVTKVKGKKKTPIGKFESESEALGAVRAAAAPKPKPKPKYKLAPTERYDGYGPNAWRGAKAGTLGARETTAAVRKEIKQAQAAGWIPEGVKVSVSHEGYAGGWSMNLRITELPPGMQLYQAMDYDEETPTEGGKVAIMRPEIADMIKKMEQIADQYNYDDSDSMTDYFNRGFYVHSGVGHELDSLHRTMALDPAKGVVVGAAAGAHKTRDLGDVQDALIGYYGSGLHGTREAPWGMETDLHRVLADNLGEMADQHGGKQTEESPQAFYRSKGKPPARMSYRYAFDTEHNAKTFAEMVEGLTGGPGIRAPRAPKVKQSGTIVSVMNMPLDVPSKRKGHKPKKKIKKSLEGPELVLYL